MRKALYTTILVSALFGSNDCFASPAKQSANTAPIEDELSLEETEAIFLKNPDWIATGFDFPIGPPNGKGYWDAQPFGTDTHLGEDWNASGRNDFGDPVYSIANGVVKFARDEGIGWGNVMVITHRLPNGSLVNSLYAHLSKMFLQKGQKVKKGQKIGNIGDADKAYPPHLHFEIRSDFFLPTGAGYGKDTTGYLNPKVFIRQNRKVPREKTGRGNSFRWIG